MNGRFSAHGLSSIELQDAPCQWKSRCEKLNKYDVNASRSRPPRAVFQCRDVPPPLCTRSRYAPQRFATLPAISRAKFRWCQNSLQLSPRYFEFRTWSRGLKPSGSRRNAGEGARERTRKQRPRGDAIAEQRALFARRSFKRCFPSERIAARNKPNPLTRDWIAA